MNTIPYWIVRSYQPQIDAYWFMKVEKHNAIFTDDVAKANKYTSKYAAKKHIKMLDKEPTRFEIVQL